MYITLASIFLIFAIGIISSICEKVLKSKGLELQAQNITIAAYICTTIIVIVMVYTSLDFVWSLFAPY